MPPRPNTIPELLAPAGGPDALRAAVANGADAVYLGVDVLNARRGAENFTLTTLPDACRFAHLRGVRVYLTVNVVVLPDELPTALTLVDQAWEAGVDAVIVQDLGLLRALRASLPHVRVHSSTQINTHNTPTIETLASIGVSRVTLAREVSVEEIATLVSASEIEVESFVHGALCMCYSGQCLMSSLIGRRSANRGLCAQPCRLPYELVADSRVLETPGAHLLSPKDLAGITMLPSLVEAGVAALKIEGRMKSAEYVALVTGVYRSALDRAAADLGGFEVRDGEQAILAESFSRGFSEAYLAGERGNEMMSYRRPNNRGVPVGRVVAVGGGVATVALDASIESADTLEFWTSAGRFAQPAGLLRYSGGEQDAAPAGAKVELVTQGAVSAGDRVFRVRNAALSAAAARTFAEASSRAIPLDFEVRLAIGQALSLTVRDAEGRSGAAVGAVVEPARTKPVTAEEVAEHIGRLGGTPYSIGSWLLELSPGAGVGFSALHRLRREAIEAYEGSVLAPWTGRRSARPQLPEVTGRRKRRRVAPALVVRVADEETALACLRSGADRAMVPTLALGRARELPDGLVPAIPRIVHDREVRSALAWASAGRRVEVGNLGLLRPAAERGAIAEADWSLNALNAHSVALLGELGASLVWLSPELSGRQIAAVAAESALDIGVGVFGAQELMVTEHCILMAEGDCDRRCGSCARRLGIRVLRDRKGYEFPVVTDILGRSHLYNSVTLDLAASIPELVDAGVAALRLDLELEGPDQAAAHTKRFREILERYALGVVPPAREKGAPSTSGHFYRGVL